ncbi:ribonuclease T2 [Pseudomonas sp. GW456-12-1-14-TSB6]|uniref:ribonuclease T2 n=1 Tax=Pseudomonas sp. GW456-12-1-14-TSB6 TaxID=2751350 RepID=UPI000CD2A4A3|nr:ribonuclease T2 [Pseudomonas sp. GW456-12-1-14-TSB6]POA30625.1 ribonuclease [Pseudomonas sp. GW456-12-1-14-TSB6]
MKKLFTIMALIALTVGSIGLSSARQSSASKAESVAGVFDYYLLALSWSPTFCLTHKSDPQCTGKGYGFVLHGLWPQYAKGGWPQSCPPLTNLSAAETAKGLTLFPTKKLLDHEWSKHGTCSGLGAMGYLDESDKAVAAVKIPEELQPFSSSYYFEAQEIADLFRKSNPGIPSDGIAVICNGPELSEVRVCMGKDLQFGACGKGVKTQCRAGDIRVPPSR